MIPVSTEFLRQVLDPAIREASVLPVKTDDISPNAIFRVVPQYARGHAGVSSVIVKTIEPDWPDDPWGADRESLFYSKLYPKLDVRKVQIYYAGVDPATRRRMVVMEDLGDAFRFTPHGHVWTPAEAACLLRTYARLHDEGRDCLPPAADWEWLHEPYNARLDLEAVPGMVQELVERGIWEPLPLLDRLIEVVRAALPRLADQPVTLLHNDVAPPNIAFPRDLEGEGVILDWHDAGWGMAELDLAYLFIQPFRPARRLDKAWALDYYWSCRRALEGYSQDPAERRTIQEHADAVLALSLLPVARKVAANPYPTGSYQKAHWDSQYGILYNRLVELCEEAAA